jgi:hypothetical protein
VPHAETWPAALCRLGRGTKTPRGHPCQRVHHRMEYHMTSILDTSAGAGPGTTQMPGDLSQPEGHQPLTPASLWHAVSASTITGNLLEWPPDLFALTDVLLEHSEAHRFAWSPPAGSCWPPDRFPNWADAVGKAGREWGVWIEGRRPSLPDLILDEWEILLSRAEIPLSCLTKGRGLATLRGHLDPSCHRRRGVRGHGRCPDYN